jgi:nucleoid DNA-binding protein
MTKSELIERLASQQSHIPAKAVEDAVKEMLEHMASTLALFYGKTRILLWWAKFVTAKRQRSP